MTGPPRSHGRLSVRPSAQPRALMEGPPALAGVFEARVVTLFPELFPGPLGASLLGTALTDGLWRLTTVDLRRFGLGKHRQVDDRPAGGGAGLVLRPDVVAPAMAAAAGPGDWPRIYLSPRGRPFDQAMARRLARADGVALLCGRFEGVDQRAIDACGLEEVSLGDFVMTGGEIAAMALLDATIRLIPRVLGNPLSVEEESFSDGLLEAPHYTRPTDWEGRPVPEVLLSGHHARIAEWRRAQAAALTKERRPDLWRARADTAGAGDTDGDRELSDAHKKTETDR